MEKLRRAQMINRDDFANLVYILLAIGVVLWIAFSVR
jgi:hypothetical protein